MTAEGKKWQILVAEDTEGIAKGIKQYLERVPITENEYAEVSVCTDFDEILILLEKHRFDLLILDLRLGVEDPGDADEAGIKALKAIQSRRFLPIIFYSAYDYKITHLDSLLIRVVKKSPRFDGIVNVVREVLLTRLPAINRAIVNHVETIQCQYMWDFVSKNWNAISSTPDPVALGYLLARRLGHSLSGPGIEQLVRELGGANFTAIEDLVYPMQYYIIPPIHLKHPLAGDLYIERDDQGRSNYFVVLTPSCDFANNKVEEILLARCIPLEEQTEYREAVSIWSLEFNKSLPATEQSLQNDEQQLKHDQGNLQNGKKQLEQMKVNLRQLKKALKAKKQGFRLEAGIEDSVRASLEVEIYSEEEKIETEEEKIKAEEARILKKLKDIDELKKQLNKQKNKTANSIAKLKSFLSNNRQGAQPERFYLLPSVLSIPDLIVDFQQLKTISRQTFDERVQEKSFNQVASLDSPFSEALLVRFTRYLGRLGTPNLNVDWVIKVLEESVVRNLQNQPDQKQVETDSLET